MGRGELEKKGRDLVVCSGGEIYILCKEGGEKAGPSEKEAFPKSETAILHYFGRNSISLFLTKTRPVRDPGERESQSL